MHSKSARARKICWETLGQVIERSRYALKDKRVVSDTRFNQTYGKRIWERNRFAYSALKTLCVWSWRCCSTWLCTYTRPDLPTNVDAILKLGLFASWPTVVWYLRRGTRIKADRSSDKGTIPWRFRTGNDVVFRVIKIVIECTQRQTPLKSTILGSLSVKLARHFIR